MILLGILSCLEILHIRSSFSYNADPQDLNTPSIGSPVPLTANSSMPSSTKSNLHNHHEEPASKNTDPYDLDTLSNGSPLSSITNSSLSSSPAEAKVQKNHEETTSENTTKLNIHQHEKPHQTFKFYAIHIGPSKTGTSAIQKQFSMNPFSAKTIQKEKDNVIYVGKRIVEGWSSPNYRKKIRTGSDGKSISPRDEMMAHNHAVSCMENILVNYFNKSNSSEHMALLENLFNNDEETRASIRRSVLAECWTWKNRSFKYMLNSSIVDSSEGYSYTTIGITQKLGARLRMMDIMGYERLIVVGGYRRYADWLVSVYTEQNKRNCLKHEIMGIKKSIPCETIEKHLKTRLAQNGFAKFRAESYKNIDRSLPEIAKAGPPNLEIKILNHFQKHQVPSSLSAAEVEATRNESSRKRYKSITTELFCDAFGVDLTPHTCEYNLELEKKQSKSPIVANLNTSALVVNKGSITDTFYQQIIAAAYRFGYLIPSDKELIDDEARKNKCNGIWCFGECLRANMGTLLCKRQKDDIRAELERITLSGQISIIGTNNSNITTWRDLSDYARAQNITWTKSLPKTCVDRKILEDLLQRSLALEELVLPEFYNTSLGKDEHKRLFWDVWHEEKKMFCWVDIERLFQNATSWDEVVRERIKNQVLNER